MMRGLGRERRGSRNIRAVRVLLGDGVKKIEKIVIAFVLIEVTLLYVRVLLQGSASGC